MLPETNFFANTEEKSKIRPMVQLKYPHLEGANYKSIINSKYWFRQSIMERTKVCMKLPTLERTYIHKPYLSTQLSLHRSLVQKLARRLN